MTPSPGERGAASAEWSAADVADRGRAALESAEQAAAEVRHRALEDGPVDPVAVREAAERAVARIDLVESEIRRSLQELRDEVAAAAAPADRGAEAPPDGAGEGGPQPAPARRRGPRLWGRRAKVARCDVCGGTADDDALDGWQQARATVLCPACQAAGWRVAERAGVPYRPARRDLQG
jgi:hypothetical protein